MKIYLVQRPIEWENPQANFHAVESEVAGQNPEKGGMIVLAEMFSTGFSFDLEAVGEPEDGPSAEFMKHLAIKHECCVVGSFPHWPKGSEKGLNRLMAYLPDGSLAFFYDKIHPFSYGKEADFYTGGARLPLFKYDDWVICPTICYDLRFPEMYRHATLIAGAELFLCVANWPSARREHWNTLLRARAIENQAVMVAVNRVGRDPLNEYSGDSAVVDARGRDLLNLGNRHTVGQVEIDKEDFLEWRTRFPALADATDEFEILRWESTGEVLA